MQILFKRISAAASAAAILAGVTGTAHAASLPPGLELAGRSLIYHANTYAPTGEVVVTASTPQGRASRALLWLESTDSHEVGVGAGAAVLPLDAAAADSTTATVIVHDAYGSHVTLSTRKYLDETIQLAVQVDAQGRLLTLPTVRLTWDHASGVFVLTRDNAVGQPLTVDYRVFDLRPGDKEATKEATATIPAGAASVTIPQLPYGFGVIVYAGAKYTAAPAEGKDTLNTLVALQ